MHQPEEPKHRNTPTILIIFGVTGDLMRRKIAPSLLKLFEQGYLSDKFKIIGYARRDYTPEQFNENMAEILKSHGNKKTISKFIKHFLYHRGRFESSRDYQGLLNAIKKLENQWQACGNRLFYLAVPPKHYKQIFYRLSRSGLTRLCDDNTGWSRVLVEKPFGNNFKTAEELDELLAKYFKEDQIYRIDHYLAKEMVQNILAFRFSNNLFEKIWDNENIASITISLRESIGVEKRGAFYDGLGALRDVGQNHLLQIIGLLTMDRPLSLSAVHIRETRSKILHSLKKMNLGEIKTNTFRAQYEGYNAIEGVKSSSKTETYFKIKTYLDTARWRGLPIYIESGKRMGEQRKEIIIEFKHPKQCLCPPDKEHTKNVITFRIEPTEEIKIKFWVKELGFIPKLIPRNFNFLLRNKSSQSSVQYIEEYQKLLLDAIYGDQTLFVNTNEVRAMWKFTDPIVNAWSKNAVPMRTYEPDKTDFLQEIRLDSDIQTNHAFSQKEISIIGLGKMGANLSRRLLANNWTVIGYNRSHGIIKELEKDGLRGAYAIKDLIAMTNRKPKVIWLMLPAGKTVDDILFSRNGVAKMLKRGDIIIDGGNSFYENTARRYRKLKKRGIEFIDVGVSGGPSGALNGASLMIGGDKKTYAKLTPLFDAIAKPNGYQFFPGAGAGHFVKMIHNGIEYGMMQSLAEGFTILKESHYKLELAKIADIYNNGSVIESRLVGWLKNALEIHGQELEEASGTVGKTGEGEWTVKTADKMKIKVKVIKEALNFRVESEKNPSYTGKLLTALRNQFGGHKLKS